MLFETHCSCKFQILLEAVSIRNKNVFDYQAKEPSFQKTYWLQIFNTKLRNGWIRLTIFFLIRS